MRASCALVALVVSAVIVAATPTGAGADQASQPSSPAAGHISTGNLHSCFVVAAALRCWGYGADGALGYGDKRSIGDDDTPDAVGPVSFPAGRTVRAVAAGTVHTCALLDDGTVRCWGFGANGRLGYGNTTTIGDDEPAASGGAVNLGTQGGVPLTATAIAAGNGHTCALLVNGALRCWGFNLDGRLGLYHVSPIGDDETPGSVAPIDLGPGHTAKAVAAGAFHTCAILDDDTVRCWGFGGDGRLGYGDVRNIGREPPSPGNPNATPPVLPVESINSAGPVDLGSANGVPFKARALTTGYGHTCAVLFNGSVRCWGYNGSGRLGYGNTNSVGDSETPGSVAPVDLGAGRTAVAIDAGEQHTCAVLDNGDLRCWGWGAFGQLGYGNIRSIGDNEPVSSVDPVDLGPGRRAVAISAAERHTCVSLDDGSTRCWGYGALGRLGYCNEVTIGDDETPTVTGPVALGVAGIPGARCPWDVPVPSPGGGSVIAETAAAPPPPPPPVAYSDDGLAAQSARAAALKSCLQDVRRRLAADRRRARALTPARRRSALRRAELLAAQRRKACRRRHGRTPGRVTTLSARAVGGRRIVLTFLAVGSDGSNPPAARRYVVRQSLRPIRTARDFARAPALCGGRCAFNVTGVGDRIILTVTSLRRRGLYYYAIAAMDNVSGRRGPRSRTIRARAR